MAARIVRPVKSTSSTRTHGQALEREGDLGAADLGLLGTGAEIVAIERDVEGADDGPLALDGRDLLSDARGQGLPPRLDADQREIGPPRLLDDLVPDAGEGPIEPGLIQHFRLLARAHGQVGGQKKCPELVPGLPCLVSVCFIPAPCGPLRVA